MPRSYEKAKQKAKKGMKARRNIIKLAAPIVLCLLGALALLALSNTIITQARRKSLPPPGSLVEVGGRKMHLQSLGSGPVPIVILPGWGNPCPGLDFGPLSRELAKYGSVTVVDYFGYGWSDSTPLPRSNKNIVDETRAALAKAGIRPPYVLLSHSLSGIYALYWVREYPGELAAIINLDTSVPELNRFGRPAKKPNWYGFLRVSGLLRLFIAVKPSLTGYNEACFSKVEIADINEMICRGLNNATVMAESDMIFTNRTEVLGASYPPDLPVLAILADSSIPAIGRYYPGMDWIGAHRDQMPGNVDGGIHLLEGSHNLYWNRAAEIAEIVRTSLEKRGLVK
jgi:pimeloyl-ACP methyl ester carboxylesterase